MSTIAAGSPSGEGKKSRGVRERLEALIKIREERGTDYRDNYLRVGVAMTSLLGEVRLRTPRDQIRFSLLNHIFSKLSRYCILWDKGGHEDSLNDLAVYSQILAEVDAMPEEDLLFLLEGSDKK